MGLSNCFSGTFITIFFFTENDVDNFMNRKKGNIKGKSKTKFTHLFALLVRGQKEIFCNHLCT